MPTNYNPSQPRAPKGKDNGGQWIQGTFDAALRKGANLDPQEPEKLPVTKKTVSEFMAWTTSKFNTYKKNDAVKRAMDILNGTSKEKEFSWEVGAYTDKSAWQGKQPYAAYAVDGIKKTLAGGRFVHKYKSDTDDRGYFEFIPEEIIYFK